MPVYPGGCYCRAIRYEVELEDADKARTSLCHCKNCKVSSDSCCYFLGQVFAALYIFSQ